MRIIHGFKQDRGNSIGNALESSQLRSTIDMVFVLVYLL